MYCEAFAGICFSYRKAPKWQTYINKTIFVHSKNDSETGPKK